MSRLLFLILFSSFLGTSTPTISGEYICDYEENTREGGFGLTTETEPRVRIVFVSFPGDPEPVSGNLNQTHLNVLGNLGEYFSSHSRGSFTLHSDSDLILHDGESFSSGNATAWEADLPANSYRETVALPPEYIENYSHLNSWYHSSSAYATVLCAEILYKIQLEYEDPNNPEDFFNNTDFIILDFLTHGSPFSESIGGRGRVALMVDNLPDFFDGISIRNKMLQGTAQNFRTGDQTVLNSRETAKVIAHEMGHAIGLFDGPPNLAEYDWDEGRYYYGNQNLMCQSLVTGEGIPAIGLGWLQQLDWRGNDLDPLVVDFTGDNLINLTMKDIRQDGGKIYKFRLDEAAQAAGAVSDQYFLLAYHAGTGIDSQMNESEDSEALMRSTGLEIWHCVGTDMFDMESGYGLYSDPVENIDLDSPDGWFQEDIELGFDNHDWWEGNSQLIERDRDAYGTYVGDPIDFFQNQNNGVADLVFNHTTNPSTHWYNDDLSVDLLKRKPQNISNSLWVEIIEQNDLEGTMKVNLLSAPYEIVTLSPAGPYEAGDTVTVTWSQNHSDLIESVDLSFSNNAGISYNPIAENQDPTLPYNWEISSDYATHHGKLKVVFHNGLSSYGGPFIYPDDLNPNMDLLEIDGQIEVTETLLTPVSGQQILAHNETRIEWTSFFNDFAHGGYGEDYEPDIVINYVTIELSKDGGDGGWEDIAGDIYLDNPGVEGPVYHYDLEENLNYYSWYPTNEQTTSNGMLRLTLNYSQGMGATLFQTESEDGLQVYPLTVKYVDRTAESSLAPGSLPDTEGYEGTPSGAIAFDADGDDDLDLFVGMDEDSAGKSRLYLNSDGSFSDGSDAFPTPFPPLDENLCSIQGDFNNDGLADLFVGHMDSPRLYINEGSPNSPAFFDLSSQLPTEIYDLLKGANCGAWVDWDHDGDLDLALGRIGAGFWGQIDPENDYLLINNGSLSNWSSIPLTTDPRITQTLSVLDFDKDSYWEIFIGTKVSGLKFFKENAGGQAFQVNIQLPAGLLLENIQNLEWIDHDNNGWFDLLVTEASGDATILVNNQNQGFSESLSVGLGLVEHLEILDFNNDGWDDVLTFLNIGSNSRQSNLQMNMSGFEDAPTVFWEISELVGLSENFDIVGSLVAAPFSPDGALDLFLGRSSGLGRYYQAVDPANSSVDPSSPAVDIRLNALSGANFLGIGAVVSVQGNNGQQQWHFIDGGSGQGNQNTTTVHFGLGSMVEPVTYNVYWPNGFESTGTLSTSLLETITMTIGDDDIGIQNVTAKSVILPGQRQNIVFHWSTALRCDNGADQVNLVNPRSIPAACQMGNPPFDNQSPGTSYSMALGADGLYHHQLVVLDVPCSPSCNITFNVQSEIGSIVQTSDDYIFSHDTCGVSYIPSD